MTAATNTGEPVLAWLSRRSEAARRSELEFDDPRAAQGILDEDPTGTRT